MTMTFDLLRRSVGVAITVGLLAGCATARPPAPSLAIMPGKNKTYEAFQKDDRVCQEAAEQAVGGQSPTADAQQSTVNGAVAGAALGAASGALIGGASNNAGQGAVLGGGLGLLAGSAIGSSAGARDARAIQNRYDVVYAQCMKTKGNDVSLPDAVDETHVIYERRPIYVYPEPYGCCGPYYRRHWW
jgi:uncharacterized protein YcfJ